MRWKHLRLAGRYQPNADCQRLPEKLHYIPFTEEQRAQARLTDVAAFLRQCGEEVKRSGSEYMWLDHGQKVTIRGNLWFHQYEQVGGDAVDFACRFYGMDYPEAVQLMLAMGVGPIQEPVEPFPHKTLGIPEKHEKMRRVYGYLLQRRGIDKEVLDIFAYRGLVYECSRYHNAVFVGTDKTGSIRHIHKRSTAASCCKVIFYPSVLLPWTKTRGILSCVANLIVTNHFTFYIEPLRLPLAFGNHRGFFLPLKRIHPYRTRELFMSLTIILQTLSFGFYINWV